MSILLAICNTFLFRYIPIFRFSFVFRNFCVRRGEGRRHGGAARPARPRGRGRPARALAATNAKIEKRGGQASERPGVRASGRPSVRTCERPGVRASERQGVRASERPSVRASELARAQSIPCAKYWKPWLTVVTGSLVKRFGLHSHLFVFCNS